jgi:hypothetical protein
MEGIWTTSEDKYLVLFCTIPKQKTIRVVMVWSKLHACASSDLPFRSLIFPVHAAAMQRQIVLRKYNVKGYSHLILCRPRIPSHHTHYLLSGEDLHHTIPTRAHDPSSVPAPAYTANPFASHQAMTCDLLDTAPLLQ